MYLNPLTSDIAKARYDDLRRTAEAERRSSEMPLRRRTSDRYNRALAWLGTFLIAWGWRVRYRANRRIQSSAGYPQAERSR